MSHLIIVHQSYQDSAQNFLKTDELNFHGTQPLVWETCRRRLLFFEQENFAGYKPHAGDFIYEELDAEEFLIEVLCGLKSPLVGETEVFGQFKNWWQNLPESFFKSKYTARIQCIYSVVKKVREESLCGLGSQSYGSLLRKKISEISSDSAIDFIGAGQLVEEMVPWVQKKWKYRIWCRNPEKVRATSYGQQAVEIKNINEAKTISQLLVVAAPLSHDELNAWIQSRREHENLFVFDLRHDSMTYYGSDQFNQYLHLDHFTSEVEGQKLQVQNHIQQAKNRIHQWKSAELSRAQVRPFGWDDL
ncbi:MAG: hypothetical protein ACXWQQ_14165 [Pseudobdellovibrio sp.]